MFKTMLVLALLIPGLGGCFWSRGGGRDHEQRGGHEEHREHSTVAVIAPVHVHCVGCGHVFRNGVWVDAD